LFTWRPAISLAPSTQTVQAEIAAIGAPSLNSTQSFSIRVTQPLRPILGVDPGANGRFGLSVAGSDGPDYTILASTNLGTWTATFRTNAPLLPFSWAETNGPAPAMKFYRIILGP
jgi:hypothetical protein